MAHAFEITFDVPFIKRALRRDLLWKGYLGAGLILAMAVGLRLWHGAWLPLMTGALVAAAGIIVWRIHHLLTTVARRIDALWRRQTAEGRIRYELDDEGFTLHLGESQSRHAWQGLRRLWRYDDVWLIEIVEMQSVFFPPDQVPAEAREFIVERCREAGVRV